MTEDEKGRGAIDLSDFQEPEVAPGPSRAALRRRVIDEAAGFRSRDPSDELAITIRGPSETIKAFKALCRLERRSQAEMLERLLDAYGEPKP